MNSRIFLLSDHLSLAPRQLLRTGGLLADMPTQGSSAGRARAIAPEVNATVSFQTFVCAFLPCADKTKGDGLVEVLVNHTQPVTYREKGN